MVKKVRRRVGAQRLRRFFEAGRHALHHAAHDHEGDGREGEGLRQPDAEPAVEPARGRDAEHHSSSWLTTPARPNSRIRPRPTTNGGVMIGSSASTLSGLAQRLVAAFGHQRHQRAEQRGAGAVSRPRNSVFQATPQRTPPARQPRPKLRSLKMRATKAVSDQLPVFADEGAGQRLEHRVDDEQRQQAPQPTTAAATNRSPRKKPRRAMPKAPRSTSAASATSRPSPCRTAARRVRRTRLSARRSSSPWRRSGSPPAQQAAMAPTKPPASSTCALRRPGQPWRRHCASARPARPMPAARAAPCARGLQQAVGGLGALQAWPMRPAAVGVLQRVPGQQQVAEQAQASQAQIQRRAQGGGRGRSGRPRRDARRRAQRGSELTSFSQRAIRRRRSALAPYFA
jgi:hypothetical protein